MAEPFKNQINADLVRQAAAQLVPHAPSFDAKAFVRLATRGLDALELKARTLHLCAALQETMPRDFGTAAAAFEAALAAPTAPGSEAPPGLQGGLRGWILWPVGEYIARQGQDQP